MSSILEALKRVESAARPAGDTGPVADFPARDPARRLRPRRLFLIGGMLALLAAAGFFFLGDRGPENARAPEPALRAKLPPEGKSPLAAAPAAPPEAPARRESRVPPPSPPATEAAPPASGAQETKGPAARPPAADPRRTGPPAVQAPPPSARLRTPAEAPPAPPRTPAPPPARPETARAPQAEGLPRLEDGRLRLMAIAWFDDPARRLAVVNGHILREGESVEGFRVRSIRRDDIIVVSEDGRSLRLELNLKTVSD